MPHTRFTVRTIDALPPSPDGQVDYWDAETPGFGIRVSRQGRKSWVVMYRHRGRLRRHTLGTYPVLSLADARQKALRALGRVFDGEDPAATKRAARHVDTFGTLATEYLEHYAKRKKKSWQEDARHTQRRAATDLEAHATQGPTSARHPGAAPTHFGAACADHGEPHAGARAQNVELRDRM